MCKYDKLMSVSPGNSSVMSSSVSSCVCFYEKMCLRVCLTLPPPPRTEEEEEELNTEDQDEHGNLRGLIDDDVDEDEEAEEKKSGGAGSGSDSEDEVRHRRKKRSEFGLRGPHL